MGQITWRNINNVNFSGSNQAFNIGANALNKGIAQLQQLGSTQRDINTKNYQQELAQAQLPLINSIYAGTTPESSQEAMRVAMAQAQTPEQVAQIIKAGTSASQLFSATLANAQSLTKARRDNRLGASTVDGLIGATNARNTLSMVTNNALLPTAGRYAQTQAQASNLLNLNKITEANAIAPTVARNAIQQQEANYQNAAANAQNAQQRQWVMDAKDKGTLQNLTQLQLGNSVTKGEIDQANLNALFGVKDQVAAQTASNVLGSGNALQAVNALNTFNSQQKLKYNKANTNAAFNPTYVKPNGKPSGRASSSSGTRPIDTTGSNTSDKSLSDIMGVYISKGAYYVKTPIGNHKLTSSQVTSGEGSKQAASNIVSHLLNKYKKDFPSYKEGSPLPEPLKKLLVKRLGQSTSQLGSYGSKVKANGLALLGMSQPKKETSNFTNSKASDYLLKQTDSFIKSKGLDAEDAATNKENIRTALSGDQNTIILNNGDVAHFDPKDFDRAVRKISDKMSNIGLFSNATPITADLFGNLVTKVDKNRQTSTGGYRRNSSKKRGRSPLNY